MMLGIGGLCIFHIIALFALWEFLEVESLLIM